MILIFKLLNYICSHYNFYYREESAVILDVRQSEDPAAYKINYTIKAISSIGVASTSLTTFSKKTAKPSSIIFDLLYNSGEISKNLINLFPGMRDRTLVASKNLIPTDDKKFVVSPRKLNRRYEERYPIVISFIFSRLYE